VPGHVGRVSVAWRSNCTRRSRGHRRTRRRSGPTPSGRHRAPPKLARATGFGHGPGLIAGVNAPTVFGPASRPGTDAYVGRERRLYAHGWPPNYETGRSLVHTDSPGQDTGKPCFIGLLGCWESVTRVAWIQYRVGRQRDARPRVRGRPTASTRVTALTTLAVSPSVKLPLADRLGVTVTPGSLVAGGKWGMPTTGVTPNTRSVSDLHQNL
jgi:hypothetical protein